MPDLRGPRRLAVVQEPKPALTGKDIAAPYTMMANAFKAAGEAVGSIGGAVGQYEKSQQNAILAETLPKLETDILKARLDHRNDPDMVQKTTAELVNRTAENMRLPALQKAVRAAGTREAQQAYRTSLVEADNRAVQNEEIGFKSELSRLNNKAVALARDGGTDTEEYGILRTEIDTLYNNLQSNPRFKFPPERAAQEKQSLLDQHKGEAIIGATTRLFNGSNSITAKEDAERLLREAAWDPALNLDPAKREQIVSRGKAALEGLTAEGKVIVEESKKLTQSYLKGIQGGAPFSETEFNDHMQRATMARDVNSITELEAARWSRNWRIGIASGDQRTILKTAQDIRNVSRMPSQSLSPSAAQQRAMDFYKTKGHAAHRSAGIVANLISEGGANLNPNAVNKGDGADGSDSIGIAQWNGRRAVALKQFAAAKGKPWNDLETQLEFVDHELQTTESRAGQMLKNARTPEEAARAMLYYERPKDFQRGHGYRETRARQIMQRYGSGSTQTAQAPGQVVTPGMTESAALSGGAPTGDNVFNATPEIQRADRPLEGVTQAARTPPNVSPEAGGPPPAPGEQAAQPPRALTAQEITFQRWAQDALNDAREGAKKTLPESTRLIIENLGKGRDIDPEVLDTWAQTVMLVGSEGEASKYVKELDEALARRDSYRKAQNMPADQQLAFRQKLQAEAAKSGGTAQQRVMDRLAQDLEQDAKDMREKPYSTYARLNQQPPVALIYNSPETFGAGVQQRSALQDRIQERSNTGPMSIFEDKAEKELFRGQVSQGAPGTATKMFQPLFNLDNGKLFATLDDSDMKDTLQGMATARDPAKLRENISILDGLYRKDPSETQRLLGDDAMTKMRTWQRNLDWMTDEQIADRLLKINDPQSAAAEKAVREQADKQVRTMTPEKIVGDFSAGLARVPIIGSVVGGPEPTAPVTPDMRNRLLGDYQTVFREFYALDQNKDNAHKLTIEKLQTKYQRSGPDGRIMLHAPEKYYPKINGDHSWFDRALTEDLERQLGPRQSAAIRPMGRNDPGVAAPLANNWDYVLVPDAQTEAEVSAGKPPSYNVLVRRVNDIGFGAVGERRMPNAGQWEVPTDDSGRTMRWPQPGRVEGILQGASIARDQAQSRMWDGWKWMNANPEDRSGPGFSPL